MMVQPIQSMQSGSVLPTFMANQRQSDGVAKPSTVQPQFGGAFVRMGTSVTDVLLKVFNKISEEYLWAFLALDVVALWITRIIKGLDRGRIPYDLEKDPDAQHLTPFEQVKRSIHENFKGLNWANGREEMLREVFTGPFALIMPTIAFMAARHKYKGAGMQMGYTDMVSYSKTYQAHIASSPANVTGKLKSHVFRENLAGFVEKLFDGNDLLDKKLGNLPNPGNHGKLNHPITLRQYLNKFATEWSKKATESIDPPAQIVNKTLDELTDELKDTLIRFNRQHMPNGTDATLSKIKLIEKVAGKAGAEATYEAVSKLRPIDDLVKNLKYFKDYAIDVYKTHHRTADSKLSEIAEYTYKKLTRNKLIFAFVATMLASWYLYLLPRFVQKEGHYPANRLLQEGGEAAAKKPSKKEHTRTAHTQQISQGGGFQEPFQVPRPSRPIPTQVPAPRTNVTVPVTGGPPPVFRLPQQPAPMVVYPPTPYSPAQWTQYTPPPYFRGQSSTAAKGGHQ